MKINIKDSFENLPDSIKNVGMIALTDWNIYFKYPKIGTMRQWDHHNRYNFKEVTKRIGGHVYIDIKKYTDWFEAHCN